LTIASLGLEDLRVGEQILDRGWADRWCATKRCVFERGCETSVAGLS
jgi:hypothetical protein